MSYRKLSVLGLVIILMSTVYMAGCTSPFGPQYPQGGCSYQGVEAVPYMFVSIERQMPDGGWTGINYYLNITLGPMDLAHKDALLKTKIWLNITHNNFAWIQWRFDAQETNSTQDGGLNVTFRPDMVSNNLGSADGYKYPGGISSPFSLRYRVDSDDAFIVNNTFSQGSAKFNGHVLMSQDGKKFINMTLDHSDIGVSVTNTDSGYQRFIYIRDGWLRTLVQFSSREICMG